jgi:hypothetical protein
MEGSRRCIVRKKTKEYDGLVDYLKISVGSLHTVTYKVRILYRSLIAEEQLSYEVIRRSSTFFESNVRRTLSDTTSGGQPIVTKSDRDCCFGMAPDVKSSLAF